MNSIPKIQPEGDWLIGMLLLISALFASTVYTNRKLLWKALMAGFFKQFYISLQREENEIYKKVSARINFISLLALALFTYLWIRKSNVQIPLWYENLQWYHFTGFTLYLLIFALLSLFVFGQIATIRLFAFIFNTQSEAREHEFNLWLIYKLMGVYVLPVLYFIAFSKENLAVFFIYLSAILFALALLRRYFVGFRLGWTMNSFPKIYSILYICTLEILPVAILVKMYKTEIQTILRF